MSQPLRLLVSRAPTQQAMFRIQRAQVEAALARCALPLPPVEVTLRETTDPDYLDELERADALVGFRFPVEAVRRTRGPLRLIQLTGAGCEHLLPLTWLPEQVALATASGIHAAKVEQSATMVLLMLHAHLPFFATEQREGRWSPRHSGSIAGRKALIFGVGGIGAALARAAKALGLEVTGVRRSPGTAEPFDRVVGPEEGLALLSEVDFVLLAMPLTPETKGLIGAAEFARMRPEAGFANFGRGGLIDQDALIATLRGGHLSGAVVDVTTPEPLPADSPLWQAPRLLITPHVCCDDPDTYIGDALDLLLDNLHRRLAGQPLRNQVDRALGY